MDVVGKPLLAHHLERLLKSASLDEVVLATTVNSSDDDIALLGQSMGVRVVRGSEADVLSRYLMAADISSADIVVRVTSDCPLIDPTLVDQVVEMLIHDPTIDYAHLNMQNFPRGLDVEVFWSSLLDQADKDPATSDFEREHVTPYIYNRPQRYRLKSWGQQSIKGNWRWCVDEPADLELIRLMMQKLLPENPNFTWRDCGLLMKEHPEWVQVNQHVTQKGTSS